MANVVPKSKSFELESAKSGKPQLFSHLQYKMHNNIEL